MRWVTHKVAAVSAAFILHLHPFGLVASLLGGILPDIFDQKLSGLFRDRQKAFNRLHRGFTHWPGLWLALLLVAFAIPPHSLTEWIQPVLLGIAIGGLSHVILDMLTPQGIPLNPFSRKSRVSLNFCKTGSIGEYSFCACIVVAMWFFMREDIMRQIGDIGRMF